MVEVAVPGSVLPVRRVVVQVVVGIDASSRLAGSGSHAGFGEHAVAVKRR